MPLREGASYPVARPRESVKLSPAMYPRRMTKADFDQIVEVIDRWWGGPISTFAHPIFFYELGDRALIVEQGSQMIGFILGFVANAQDETSTGYVHFVGIHPDYRRRGMGRLLSHNFTDACSAVGCGA